MESVTRYLNVAYLTAGLILVWLFVRTSGMVFDWFGPRADRMMFGFELSSMIGVVIGVGITAWCWRSEKVYGLATEVATELSRVTWPEKAETQRSTYVVIIVAIILSLVLATFDFFWKFVTDLIL